jgi:isochorismate pyruvate lyase
MKGTRLVKPPSDCADMDDIRQAIDQIDRDLIALLVRRAGYIDRAAEIKEIAQLPARIPDRVEQVVGNVRQAAHKGGLDPDLAEILWRRLIDWSIAREETRLGPDSDRKDMP